MDLRKMLMLCLTLVAALMSADASPISMNLLARRSRSATVGSSSLDPDSTAYSSASGVVQEGAETHMMSASELLTIHFDLLKRQVAHLHRRHQRLYSLYKNQYFSADENSRITDVTLNFLPNVTSLPAHRTRARLPDKELVSLHYNNLVIFKYTLVRVRDSETGNVTEPADNVIRTLNGTTQRLEEIMTVLGGTLDTSTSLDHIPVFHSGVTLQERNTRTMLVLQEFDDYMLLVKLDCKVLARRHPETVA